ncbi:glycosyltransferase [Desulfitobacterium metallireducens]|uniref:Glycosyl transferase family 2 n=1 Tax=Desulfitobacterium metallireducens DSM 15288 TaxID=871968 RepID=W0EBD3_9FIRM|nr:glycosyltransferase family 2 protein [Desulfitobacterium metallireducens]AHF06371.1 glycosyl transferase family 2 [Desulfitobacterium metallireducens DSM 15288]
MNTFFSVLSIISMLMIINLTFLLLRYVKEIPAFGQNKLLPHRDNYPSLSIVIPACNEELFIEQTARRLLNQEYPNLEVVVVNDRSTDNTGAVLEKLNAEYPQLKVITIKNLPENWLGKTNAIYQGVKNSSGEWLLFTDADVLFAPGSLKETVGYAVEHNLDHLGIAPDIYYGSAFYRAFIGYVAITVTMLLMFSKKGGMGAFNLVKRSVYDAVGGYQSVAMKVVDDLSFGEVIVDKGYKQKLGRSNKGFITVKWYNNLRELFRGFEKNQFASAKYSVAMAVSMILFVLLINVYPFIGLFLGPIWARILCGISILNWIIVYNDLAKKNNVSPSFVIFHPLCALFEIGAVLNSMFKTLSKGGVEWRGQFYSIKELKKNI